MEELGLGQMMAATLQYEGHRITKLRRALLDLFYERNEPMSASVLIKYLDELRVSYHKTTLYRELQFLQDECVIKPLSIPGEVMYELVETDHHHHVVCMKCRKVKDIELNDRFSRKTAELEKQTKFKITHHSLEFFGLCANCQ